MNLNAICIGINSRSSNETARFRSLALDFASPLQPFDPRITYTGASARMRFDSTGTLKYAPMNLLTYSEQFDNAAWVKTNASITTNTAVAPDGATTADKLVENTSTTVHQVSQSSVTATIGAVYSVSIYAKSAGDSRRLAIFMPGAVFGTGSNDVFDLDLGTVVSTESGTATIQSVGNGWYRCSCFRTATVAATFNPTFRLVNSAAPDALTYLGDGTSGLFVWGAQLNLGSTAFDYIPTTTAAVYLPRSNAYQDHNPSTLAPLGFLIEEARTNSIRNNTMQGAVAGTPGTVPTGWILSTASGNLTAREIVGVGTENGVNYIDVRFEASGAVTGVVQFIAGNLVAASNGQQWVTSNFCKLQGGTLANVTVQHVLAEANAGGTFIAGGTSNFTPTTAALNTQRREYARTNTQALTAFVYSAVFVVFSGAGNITLRIGLPQLELGAFATSPILTTAAAATRLADVASITGTNFSSFWNQVEGTIVVNGSYISAQANFGVFCAANDNTSNNSFVITKQSAGSTGIYTQTITGGVSQAVLFNVATSTAATALKLASSYKVNDFAAVGNGGVVSTDVAGSVPAVTQLFIGAIQGTLPLNGHIQSLTYYNKRLPNATLQSLTV